MRKRNHNVIWVFCLSLFFVYEGGAQDTLRLSKKEFLQIVQQFHPVMRQSNVQNEIAQQQFKQSKGAFDPILGTQLGEKSIDGVQYYTVRNAGIDIPTWYGIDFNAAYSQYNGNKLDNSDTKGTLFQAGINVPLLKELVYDKRRAALQQADNMRDLTRAEQVLVQNELMLDAENCYYEWARSYYNYLIQLEAVRANFMRLNLTISALNNGERPAIDTMEAYSQLQNFELQAQDALLRFQKNTQELQWFLWKENQEFYILNKPILPADSIDLKPYSDFKALINFFTETKPGNYQGVRYYSFKQKNLEIDKRLKQLGLLPKLSFSYNVFSRELNIPAAPLFGNNVQYGFKLGIPILMRQARAELKITRLKLFQNNQSLKLKEKEFDLKNKSYRLELENYYEQIKIASENLMNYEKLLKAEEIRFENGESSLFVINTRENKLIESKEKILSLKVKFINAYNRLKWLRESMQP